MGLGGRGVLGLYRRRRKTSAVGAIGGGLVVATNIVSLQGVYDVAAVLVLLAASVGLAMKPIRDAVAIRDVAS